MKHEDYHKMIHNAYYGDIVCPECQSIKLYENGYTKKRGLKLGCENCGFEFKENDCLKKEFHRFYITK